MENLALKAEIELLRNKLYQALENAESRTDILHISQKLDELILQWMQFQKNEYEKKKACNI